MIRWVNPAFCRISGFSRDRIVGRRPPHPFWLADAPIFEDTFAKARAGDAKSIALDLARADGTRIPVQLLLTSIRDESGENALLVGALEARLSGDAAEPGRIGILIVEGPDAQVCVANAAGLGVLGYSRAELTRETTKPVTSEFFRPDGSRFDWEDLPIVRATRRGETSRNIPVKIRFSDARELWVASRAIPLRSREGEVVGGVGIFVEVEDPPETEPGGDGRERFRTLLSETSHDLITAIPENIDARIVEALAKLGDFAGADRALVRWLGREGEKIDAPHIWEREPGSFVSAKPTGDEIPWAYPRLASGLVLRFRDIEELPLEAHRERELYQRSGTRSLLMIPVGAGLPIQGVLQLATTGEERDWSNEQVAQIEILCDVIVSAVEKVRSEKRLRVSEERYRRIVEDQTDLVARWRPDGALSFINPAFGRLLEDSGGAPPDGGFTHFTRFLLPGSERSLRELIEPLRRNAPTPAHDEKIEIGDEETRWYSWTDQGIFDATGELIEIQSVGRDITARKEAEASLARQAAFQSMLAEVGTALLTTAPEALDAEIENALARIGQFYGLESVGLWSFHAGNARRESRWPPGSDAPTEIPLAEVPWSVALASEEKPCVVRTKSETIRHMGEWENLRPDTFESALIIPRSRDGRMLASLFALSHLTEWSEEVLRELSQLTNILASTAARNRLIRSLNETDRILRLSQEIGQVGSWAYWPKTGKLVASKAARSMFGLDDAEFDLNEAGNLDHILSNVHPEDRERALRNVARISEGTMWDSELLEGRLIGTEGVRYVEALCFTDDSRDESKVVGAILDVTRHKESEAALADALNKLQLSHEQVTAENVHLRQETLDRLEGGPLIGRSRSFTACLELVVRMASSDAPVLILGETGTGKELIARALHEQSSRSKGPMISVNCAALSESLIESELFGHEKGAFTGASSLHRGRFELADGGSLFLDEIGDLSPAVQVKLLRVLQEGAFERVGGSAPIRVDVRIIAATHRDLLAEVERGRFREDLYYRINTLPIPVPPLRERPGDIPLLADHFARLYARRLGKETPTLSLLLLERLSSYGWPGNARELESVMQRVLIAAKSSSLDATDLMPFALSPQAPQASAAPRPLTLSEAERDHIRATLERCGGVIEGPRGAAVTLGLSPSTLRSRMKKLGLERPRRT